MALTNGNPLIDAETTLVGWTNRSAIRNSEHTFLSGHDIQIAPADLPNLDLPAVCFAKALVTPTTPAGMHVGLTATIAA